MSEHAQGEFWFQVPDFVHHRISNTDVSVPKDSWSVFNNSSSNKQNVPPLLLSHPQGPIDNFTKIEGINVDIQADLYALGIFHYWQISEWTSNNVDWLRERTFLIGSTVDISWIDAARMLNDYMKSNSDIAR